MMKLNCRLFHPVLFSISPSFSLQATGVSDVNEVIQKMVSQESTAESLMILTKENQVGRNLAWLRDPRHAAAEFLVCLCFFNFSSLHPFHLLLLMGSLGRLSRRECGRLAARNFV